MLKRFFSTKINKIALKAEICIKWGFLNRSNRISAFVDYLQDKGYETKLDIIPKNSGQNEYYLIQLLDSKDNQKEENVIYTNNKIKHPNASFGKLDEILYSDIEKRLKL